MLKAPRREEKEDGGENDPVQEDQEETDGTEDNIEEQEI